MCLLHPLPEGATAMCRVCEAPAEGTLAGGAVVDPWLPDHLTDATRAAARRVLKEGDALCDTCGWACAYLGSSADAEDA